MAGKEAVEAGANAPTRGVEPMTTPRELSERPRTIDDTAQRTDLIAKGPADARSNSSEAPGTRTDVTRTDDRADVGRFDPKEKYTKEAYSPFVSAVAFDALRKETGKDFIGAGKWSATTREQKWWAKSMEEAAGHLTDVPKGVEIKSKVSIGDPEPVNRELGTHLEKGRPDSLFFGSKIKLLEHWDAKAKVMPVKDGTGQMVKDESGHEKYFPSVYKQGTVFNLGGEKVFQIHDNAETGLKTFAIPNPGNLPAGMDVSNYAQDMVRKALASKGQLGPVEFPMYDKKIEQALTGIIGMGVNGTDMYIAQAQGKLALQANESGQLAEETQVFEIRSRGIHIDHDPPAVRLDKPFIVAQVSPAGRVFISGTIGVDDMKRPQIDGLDK